MTTTGATALTTDRTAGGADPYARGTGGTHDDINRLGPPGVGP